MTTWEYLTTPLLIHNTAAILNNWGKQGWELVQVVPAPKEVSSPTSSAPSARRRERRSRRGRCAAQQFEGEGRRERFGIRAPR
jgi:hypothetical protein